MAESHAREVIQLALKRSSSIVFFEKIHFYNYKNNSYNYKNNSFNYNYNSFNYKN